VAQKTELVRSPSHLRRRMAPEVFRKCFQILLHCAGPGVAGI